MSIIYADQDSTTIKKRIFKLKPIQKNGLIVQIHHTLPNKTKRRNIRFVYSAFNNSELILANADIDGNIFIIDFANSKFWSLPKFNSCTVLAFSELNIDDLIVGTNDGRLYIVHIHLGLVKVVLEGHRFPVKEISFANEYCLSVSVYEAIIFDLKDYKKIHKLTLESDATLKHVLFTPITHYIVACFTDDFIHIWKNKTFESYKQILPTTWNRIAIKSIAFSRNGSLMAVAGYSPIVVIFTLDTWTLSKILNLPAGINSIRLLEFLSQPHDGGSNKFLVLLSNDGVLYFLDLENCIVISKIQKESEVISFNCSSYGTHLACVLHSGEINVYKISVYLDYHDINKRVESKSSREKIRLFLPPRKHAKYTLDINNLREILKEYGEYPESYRTLIWTKILELPKNVKAYSALNNKDFSEYLNKIEAKYPLVNKCALKNLKKVLSSLGNWCPLFYHVTFLPLFVFPFIKIFENDPVACFEAVCTIILNWCQHWFQYIPCPPINVLSMIENILKEHDPHLWKYFSSRNVTPLVYAWPLLEVAFSEVLTIKEWSILWDHILSNEPSFLLMCVVSYNIINRLCIMTLSKLEDIKEFYRNQNSIDFKKFITKSYYLNTNTSNSYHPRQYLNDFQKLPKGTYPVFNSYPTTLLTKENATKEHLKEMEEQVTKVTKETSKQKLVQEEREKDELMQKEETERIKCLEDFYYDKVLEEKERIDKQRIYLSELKTNLHKKQAELIEKSRKKIEDTNLNERKRELNHLLKNIEYIQSKGDLHIQQTEEDLSRHYVELLEQKTRLEDLLLNNKTDLSTLAEYEHLQEHHQKMSNELDDIQRQVQFNRFVNTIEIPRQLSVISDSMQEIDVGLAREVTKREQELVQSYNTSKILKMENDTNALEKEVQYLLDQLTQAKLQETQGLLSEITKNAAERKQLAQKSEEIIDRLKRLDSDYRDIMESNSNKKNKLK